MYFNCFLHFFFRVSDWKNGTLVGKDAQGNEYYENDKLFYGKYSYFTVIRIQPRNVFFFNRSIKF